MKQAISRMERALSRLEQGADTRLIDGVSLENREKAAQALQALDTLLAELKGAPHG